MEQTRYDSEAGRASPYHIYIYIYIYINIYIYKLHIQPSPRTPYSPWAKHKAPRIFDVSTLLSPRSSTLLSPRSSPTTIARKMALWSRRLGRVTMVTSEASFKIQQANASQNAAPLSPSPKPPHGSQPPSKTPKIVSPYPPFQQTTPLPSSRNPPQSSKTPKPSTSRYPSRARQLRTSEAQDDAGFSQLQTSSALPLRRSMTWTSLS